MATKKTKAELEKELKNLKDDLKELLKINEELEAKVGEAKESEPTHTITSLFVNEKNEQTSWHLADIHFNPYTGVAYVDNIREKDGNNRSFDLALMEGKKNLVQYLGKEQEKMS